MHEERRTRPWVGPVVGVGVILLMLTCCVGIAIPNFFVKMNTRPKSSEAKSNLKYAFTAEKSYFGEKDRYDESVDTVGFKPEFGTRYRYFFSKTDVPRSLHDAPDGGLHTGFTADEKRSPTPNNAWLLAGIPPAVLSTVGIEGVCPACEITIVAAGNVDKDATVDVWSISTKPRTIDGELIQPGQPFNHVNDVEN